MQHLLMPAADPHWGDTLNGSLIRILVTLGHACNTAIPVTSSRTGFWALSHKWQDADLYWCRFLIWRKWQQEYVIEVVTPDPQKLQKSHRLHCQLGWVRVQQLIVREMCVGVTCLASQIRFTTDFAFERSFIYSHLVTKLSCVILKSYRIPHRLHCQLGCVRVWQVSHRLHCQLGCVRAWQVDRLE